MKKIIIFGATGNTGCYFVDYCAAHLNPDEYEIIAVGRKTTDFFNQHGIKYIQVDISNKEDFLKLPKNDIYAVVNMAGLLPAYAHNPTVYDYTETNIIGGLNILEYARETAADRTLYTQTRAELKGFFGKEEVLSPQMPRNIVFSGDHAFYTISKTLIVDTMEYYWREYGLKKFVFRLPNIYLYSPLTHYYIDGKKHLIAYRYMIERASKGEPLEMWGNPDVFKDVVYVKDLCQMMYKALFAKVDGGIYHVGTGVRTTLREQIEGIIKVFSPKGNPSEIISRPEKSGFLSFVMDIENAKKDLGYNPEYDYISYLEDYKKERKLKRFDALWKS